MFEYIGLGAKFIFSSEGIDQVDGIVTRLRTLETQFRTSGTRAREFGGAMQDMGTALMSSGLATTLAGIAQGYATLNGIMSAADWESNMMDAIKYMDDDSVEKQKAYNEAITETAIQLGKTREEINKATISYMQMGKSVDDAIRLAKNASFAATTWDMDAEQVAKSFRVMKSSLEVDMEDQNIFTDITNQINEVGNRTAATSKNVVELIQYAGAALHQTGKASIQDIMAMASAAAYANIPMGEFGTAMNTMMNRYVKDGGKYFGKLGVEVKNAAGEMRPFMDVIDEVAVKWKTLTSTQREEFLSGFGMHHASRLGAFIGANSEFHKAKDQVIPNTPADSAQKEYERVTDTFNNKWQAMMTSIKALTQTVFTPLMKALQPIIQGITKVSEVLRNMTMNNEGLATLVSGFITLSTVAVLAVGGAMLLSGALFKLNGLFVAGAFKTNIFTKALEAVRITMRNLSPQFLILKNSLGPLILQFAKFAGMSAVLYGVWKYDLFGIKSLFTDFFENLKIEFGKVQTLLKADISVEGFKQGLYDMAQSGTVLDKVGSQVVRFGILWQALCEGWTTNKLSPNMKAKLEDAGLLRAWELIMMTKVRIGALFEGIKKGFGDTFTFVRDVVKTCIAPIALFVTDYILLPIANALGLSADTVEWFSDLLKGKLKDNKDDWIRFGEVIGKILGALAVGLVIGKLVKFFQIIGGGIKTVLKFSGTLKSGAGSAFTRLGGIVKSVTTFFSKDLFKTLQTTANFFRTTLPNAVIHFRDILVGKINNMTTAVLAFRSKVGIVVNFMREKLASLLGWISKFSPMNMLNGMKSVLQRFVGMFTSLPSKLGGALNALRGFVQNVALMFRFIRQGVLNMSLFTHLFPKLGGAISQVSAVVRVAMSGLGGVFSSLLGFIMPVLTAVGSFVLSLLGITGVAAGVAAAVGAIVIAIVGFLALFIACPEQLGEALGRLAAMIVKAFGGAWEGISNFISTAWTAIYEFFTVTIPTKADEFINYMKTDFATDLQNFISDPIGFLFETGKNIIEGLWKGIDSMKGWLMQKWGAFTKGFKKGFDDEMGIHSPSRVMYEKGQNTVQGLANGIFDSKWLVDNQIVNIVSSIVSEFIDLIRQAVGWGSNLINDFASGISSAVGAVISAVSGITSSISNVLGGVVDNAFSWGKNMAKGFGDGISAMSSYISGKANSIMLNVSDYLGFHSPSKKGEGQHIVEWGSNMVKGFADGVIDKRDYLSDIISTLIKPISGVIDVSPKFSTLEEKPKISNGYLSDVKQSLNEAKRNVSETISNVSARSINIANGAIQNHFTINGSENPQDIANYIMRVLDENLMRMLEDKMLEAYARTNS